MKKEIRSQIEEFVEYNKELRRLSAENFEEKREKDIVSFWIRCINFELNSRNASGIFQYHSSKLSYGLDGTKLDLKDLSSEEFKEILGYYWRKGYTLNHYDNIIIDNPDIIVIDWSNPNRQKLKDKIYILKFRCSKLKKFFKINKLKYTFLESILLTIKDFYWYYFWNNCHCMKATKLYRKSLKSKKVIERRKKIRNFVNKNNHPL